MVDRELCECDVQRGVEAACEPCRVTRLYRSRVGFLAHALSDSELLLHDVPIVVE